MPLLKTDFLAAIELAWIAKMDFDFWWIK